MWESRHGFPSRARTPGRHRRYSDRDVELVIEVTRLRDQGLSLSAAIGRARIAQRHGPASVFSGLRERHPEVHAAVMPKRSVLELTHAIEDEYCARAANGVLIGCFQRERFYRQAQRRWRELARSADLAIAIADFDALREPRDAPAEVPIGRDQPLAREWTLIVDAPRVGACLAAWEQPGQRRVADSQRRFEVLWSFEPAVVRAATSLAAELLHRLAPSLAERMPPAVAEPAPAATAELRFATSLAHRMVGYLTTIGEDRARTTGQPNGDARRASRQPELEERR
jgi:DICT domain-containing protein